MATSILPSDFLSHPAPDIKIQRIDFSETDLPRYAGLYAVILDNVLSTAECDQLVKAAETSTTTGWERAMVNVGGGRQAMYEDVRNCGRIIWDSPAIVDKVWKRVEHIRDVQEILRLEKVPRIFGNGPVKRHEVWKFSRPNERMRFLKYVGGEYFRPHCDGSYQTPDGKERSYFTLHLYLNNAVPTSKQQKESLSAEQGEAAEHADLVGGATTFHDYAMDKRFDVLPQAGRILIFQHRDLLHSGDDVRQGVKYTMRTDLMYAKEVGEDGLTEAERVQRENTAGGQAVVAEEASAVRSKK